jgi:hypothetical protein
MAKKNYVWVVHKNVTGDNKYNVDVFGDKTVTHSFNHLDQAKSFAKQEAKRKGLKSFDYHDSFENLKTISVTDKPTQKKKEKKQNNIFGFSGGFF